MNTQTQPHLVAKPSLVLNLALLTTLLAPGAAHAQAQTQRWQCEADCFVLQADGVSLAYDGNYRSAYFKKRSDAFKDIADHGCGKGNLLLKRVLNRIETQQSTQDVTDRERETRYRYRRIETTSQVRRYQILSNDLCAVFDTSEATEDNSCKQVTPEPERIDVLPNGDRALG